MECLLTAAPVDFPCAADGGLDPSISDKYRASRTELSSKFRLLFTNSVWTFAFIEHRASVAIGWLL